MTGNSTAGRDGAPAEAVEDHHRTKGLLRLTMVCNEQCSFCNVPSEEHAGREATAEDVERTLLEFGASGQRTLTISGGEPSLRRSLLLATVAKARAGGIDFVELQTNAVRIDTDYATELAVVGLTSAFVPLLSHEPSAHDELMGRAGAFTECLRGIDALLSSGVEVTLNVVIAARTQSDVPAIVDFVADRLSGVRWISLSAVQPHGRAAKHLELLPDYAALGPAVRRAQARARRHDIELLNPYCGLPVCVGWEKDQARCVEAIEAGQLRGASFGDVFGVDNRGDKIQGQPCRRCALRTRCGGAWRAYWTVRGGSGLAPPERRLEPWEAGADSAAGQTLVVDHGPLSSATLKRLEQATAPTVWLQTDDLGAGDAARLRGAGCTDLALVIDPALWPRQTTLQQELGQIAKRNELLVPQATVRTLLELLPSGTFRDRYRVVEIAAGLGVEAVRLKAPARSKDRFHRFVEAVRDELPQIDLGLIETEARPG